MRTNIFNLSKTLLLLIFVITFSLNFSAQSGEKLKRKPKPSSQGIENKPAITFPTAGSVIDGPFVIMGKAEPNTYINLRVSPIYNFPANPSGKPTLRISTKEHNPQEFSIKADEKGIWQSPPIQVLFDPKAINTKIFAFVSQKSGSQYYESKNIEYKTSPKLFLKTVPMKIPAKNNNDNGSSGQPQKDEPLIKGGDISNFKIISPFDNKNVGNDGFYISGEAPEGALVRVEVRFSGYKSKSEIKIGNIGPIFPIPTIDKNTTTVNNALWGTYNVRYNSLMKIWITDEIKLIKKSNDYSYWANTYTITASLVNEKGQAVNSKTIQVSRMKTKAI